MIQKGITIMKIKSFAKLPVPRTLSGMGGACSRLELTVPVRKRVDINRNITIPPIQIMATETEIRNGSSRAFSLIELLVVFTIILILAAMFLPVLSRAKSHAQSTMCLNNLKQLQLGWKLYESDNNDWFPENVSRVIGGIPQSVSNSWVLGNAQFDVYTTGIRGGSLYTYENSTSIYHCPADEATVQGNASLHHTRSYSVENFLGSNFDFGGRWVWPEPYPIPYVYKTKESLITQANPSEIFVFIDDNEQTMDDGIFILWNYWFDYPANRHRQGANLSYLDGHVEHKRWVSSKAAPKPYTYGMNLEPRDRQDFFWLVDRMPTG